jgi:hypothetical protein
MTMNYSILGLALLLVSCGGSAEPASEEVGTPSGPHLLEPHYLSAAPDGAVEVGELRSLGDGATVVVRGDVRDYAPVEGKAVLTLYDHSLVSCDEMGDDDHCATPWDFCCEDGSKIKLGSAVVEFREEGRLVAASFEGLHGLGYLSDVVVTGTLGVDETGNLKIVADGIHVE